MRTDSRKRIVAAARKNGWTVDDLTTSIELVKDRKRVMILFGPIGEVVSATGPGGAFSGSGKLGKILRYLAS